MRDIIVGAALAAIIALLAAQLVVELALEETVEIDEPMRVGVVSSEELPVWTQPVKETAVCLETTRASLKANTDFQEAYFDANRDPSGVFPMGEAAAANDAYMHALDVCNESQ